MQQGFRNSSKGCRERETLLGKSFYQGGGNLRSEFDHLNFFQSLKHYSVNSEHCGGKTWWGSLLRGIFLGGENEQIFVYWGDSPHPTSRENPAWVAGAWVTQ